MSVFYARGRESRDHAACGRGLPCCAGEDEVSARLSYCDLRTVPSFLGGLESLEILDLYNNNDLQIDAPLVFLIEGYPRLRKADTSKDKNWTPESMAHVEAFKAKLRAKNPDAKVLFLFRRSKSSLSVFFVFNFTHFLFRKNKEEVGGTMGRLKKGTSLEEEEEFVFFRPRCSTRAQALFLSLSC